MEFYQRLLISLIPIAVALALSRLVFSKNSSDNKTILQIPQLYRIVAFIAFCVFTIASICILLFQFEEWPFIILIMGFFGLPSLIMAVMWSLWKVEIKPDGFIYRNFFGRKKEYKFIDLEYQMHPRGLKWYFYKGNKKVFCMPYYIEGGDNLEKRHRSYIKKIKKQDKS